MRQFGLFVAALLVTGCVTQRRDWDYVQSVGGMAVGTPYRTKAGVMLPVAVDVSGLKTITTPPRTINSAEALDRITVERAGFALDVSVVTTVAGKGARTTSADLSLGDLAPGRYRVRYAQPDGGRIDLGEIVVPP